MTADHVIFYLKDNPAWLKFICSERFSFITYMATPPLLLTARELTVRIPTEEKTRWGKDKPQRRRFDLVGLVKPHYKAYGDELFTLGIEVKISRSDLRHDTKISDYLGYTDVFYLAVPQSLLDEAREKRGQDTRIGILCLDEKTNVVKVAERAEWQTPTLKCRSEVLQELLLKTMDALMGERGGGR